MTPEQKQMKQKQVPIDDEVMLAHSSNKQDTEDRGKGMNYDDYPAHHLPGQRKPSRNLHQDSVVMTNSSYEPPALPPHKVIDIQ